jgi:hypothetical protein
LIDVTSRGPQPWVRFSPFYPHGDLLVPFSPGQAGASVEGIWQGLKVFARQDVDLSKLQPHVIAPKRLQSFADPCASIPLG